MPLDGYWASLKMLLANALYDVTKGIPAPCCDQHPQLVGVLQLLLIVHQMCEKKI